MSSKYYLRIINEFITVLLILREFFVYVVWFGFCPNGIWESVCILIVCGSNTIHFHTKFSFGHLTEVATHSSFWNLSTRMESSNGLPLPSASRFTNDTAVRSVSPLH